MTGVAAAITDTGATADTTTLEMARVPRRFRLSERSGASGIDGSPRAVSDSFDIVRFFLW
jgi:hypothetical protein